LDKTLKYFVAIIFLSLALSGPGFAAGSTPVEGGKLPAIRLPISTDSGEKIYLGLSGEGFFEIPQIKAEGVLIKVFNIYCPVCQSTALAMAKLYRQIENNSDLKNRIKLIGIGAGNTLTEIEVFRQTNDIPFPIFPDEDLAIHNLLGEVRIPSFIAIRMEKDGSHKIVYIQLGGFTDTTLFLDSMVEAYGIKQGDERAKEAALPPNEFRVEGVFK
jgi:thiol-disulfide isomerase/thioredoxin